MTGLALALGLAAAPLARAQGEETAEEGEETAEDEATAEIDEPIDLLDREARGLYDAGVAAYAAERYREAYRYFQRAYVLSHREGLLYNMVVTAERAGFSRDEVDELEALIRASPDTPRRTRALTRARRLRTPDDDDDDDPPEDEPVGAYVLVALGIAAAAAGGVALGIGLDANATVEGADRGAYWDTFASTYQMGLDATTAATVLLAAGGAALAVGVVWWIAVGSGPSERRVTVSATPSGVVVRGEL